MTRMFTWYKREWRNPLKGERRDRTKEEDGGIIDALESRNEVYDELLG
jgi:hypothetical protein